ncbi:MAG: tetratricopeptide repeat protein [Bacteroidota bacterium]|nr:tetratricopeptide repeat protein [Bacteroidota bacterium]
MRKISSLCFVSILSVMLLWCNALSGQKNNIIDSLQNVLKKSKEDTNKVNTLNLLCKKLVSTDPQLVNKQAEIAVQLAKRLGYNKGLGNAYNNLGNSCYFLGDYEKSLTYHQEALKIREEQRDKVGIAASYTNIGLVYERQADYGKAISFHLKALKINELIGDKLGLAKNSNNIGMVYDKQRDFKNAISYYEKARKLYEETGNKDGVAKVLNNIGLIYNNKKDYKKALEYYNQSLKIMEELNNSKGICKAYMNIGAIYGTQNNSQEAYSYFQKALSIAEESGYKNEMVGAYYNMGVIKNNAKNFNEALNFYKKSLTIAMEIGDKDYIKNNYNSISETYSEMNNFKLAFEYHVKYSNIKDSIFNEESSKAIAEMQGKYNTEKKERENQLLVQKNKTQDLKLKNNRIIIYSFTGGFILVLILSIVIFINYRQKQKANKLLEQKNIEIEKNNKLLEVKNIEIEKKNDELEVKNIEIEKKNEDITSSIRYAKQIQQAILPPIEYVKNIVPDSFILYLPKDIVSGDFYFFEQKEDKIFFAAVDCTGHGVPGAFMSIVGYSTVNQALNEHKILKPSEILNFLSKGINKTLRKSDDESSVKDGMDLAFCSLDRNKMMLEFAGAYNPMYLVRSGEVQDFKADVYPVGVAFNEEFTGFTNHEIPVQKGDTIYVFSDGYVDQFGGPKRKKFLSKKLRETLMQLDGMPMDEQKEILHKTHLDWRGDGEQIDDILIIGVRV